MTRSQLIANLTEIRLICLSSFSLLVFINSLVTNDFDLKMKESKKFLLEEQIPF